MTVGRWGPLVAGVLIAGAWLPDSAHANPFPTAITGTVDPQGASIAIRLTIANREDAPSSDAIADLYLSTDGLVDSQDVRLAAQPIPPLEAHRDRSITTSVPIPNTVPGRYYLLVRIRGDQGSAQHDLWGAPLFLGPDLKISQPVGVLEAGALRVETSVTNAGTTTAGPTRIAIALAKDKNMAPVPLLSMGVPALAAGQSLELAGSAALPDATPGSYHLVAQINPDRLIAEADETNNVARGDHEIRLGPDLTIIALSASVSDGVVIATDRVSNQGTSSTEPCGIAFFLSRNGVLDADDVLIGHRVLPPLTAGEPNQGTTRLPLPRKLTPGRYYMLGKADASNAVTESDETNNLVLAPTPLDIRLTR